MTRLEWDNPERSTRPVHSKHWPDEFYTCPCGTGWMYKRTCPGCGKSIEEIHDMRHRPSKPLTARRTGMFIPGWEREESP